MRLYGLDLFSGIGGNTLALREWIKTIAYCEQDRHAQSVLLSRMADKSIESAPIWDDVTTLTASMFNVPIDIIIAGFPCQDISVAGKGAGLAGKRSGLFFEIMRLAKEIKPTFLFLENVPAIRTRGLDTVIRELTEAGYDSRWCMLSAAEVGAKHRRHRWFLLGYSERPKLQRRRKSDVVVETTGETKDISQKRQRSRYAISNSSKDISTTSHIKRGHRNESKKISKPKFSNVANSDIERLEIGKQRKTAKQSTVIGTDWWIVEPEVGRVAHGIPFRVDRIKRLGNAVVPAQAREAFKYLMGIR